MNTRNIILFAALCGLAAVLCGCTITIPPAVDDAIGQAIGQATNKPPVVVAPVATNAATVIAPPAVDLSGELCDPNPAKYTPDYVSGNASYEECHIEPATGLMLRTAFYRASVGQWWLLSGLAEGHIRRVGDNLVADTFTVDGYAYEVFGFTKYEPQVNERPDQLKLFSKGNTSPYNGDRQYCHWLCRKAK